VLAQLVGSEQIVGFDYPPSAPRSLGPIGLSHVLLFGQKAADINGFLVKDVVLQLIVDTIVERLQFVPGRGKPGAYG
jgi:hypothetical protein